MLLGLKSTIKYQTFLTKYFPTWKCWDRDNPLIVAGAEAWISWCKLRAPLTSWLLCCGCQADAGDTPVCSGLPGESPSMGTRSPVAWTWGCPGEGRRRGCQGRWQQAGGCQPAGEVRLALAHTWCWQFWNEIHLDYPHLILWCKQDRLKLKTCFKLAGSTFVVGISIKQIPFASL